MTRPEPREPDIVRLPPLPAGADDALRVKRDLAIATLALKDRITLQQAADTLAGVMGTVEREIRRVTGNTTG